INVFSETLRFKNSEIFEFWLGNNRNVVNYIKGKIPHDLHTKLSTLICTKARSLSNFIKIKWEKQSRNEQAFRKYNEEWLNLDTVFVIPKVSNATGRPKTTYVNSRERNKRRLASELASQQGGNAQLLVHAASISAKNSNETDLKFVLHQVAMSPNRPSKIRKLLNTSRKEVTPVSPDEALMFLLENGLTKQQYCNMRQLNIKHNSGIFPSYDKVYKRKLQCRPDEIKANESSVEVSLQNLVDHTAKRIFAYQDEVLCTMDIEESTLILSYGFDGSTGHSLFKQKFVENISESFDQSLFITSVIPIKIISSTGDNIWVNRTPQSVHFCRPLKVEFVKETKEHILTENHNINEQIEKLKSLQYTLSNGRQIRVTYDLYMTLIDGKVLNVLTETKSAQQCPICHSGPNQFRTIRNFDSPQFEAKSDALKFGISPLHAWIRSFEFVLKLSYKLDLKKWQVRGKEEKKVLAEKKHQIQK
ncbi:uncharacterized protein LOC142222645, partial [Haematobia irritans]|uniref:uncharacterized protein LOC142222645 n=1 Tax=Haematobia irritans TaxID=7368 RepID=UPI003F508ACA